jgi:hypothetical protein
VIFVDFINHKRAFDVRLNKKSNKNLREKRFASPGYEDISVGLQTLLTDSLVTKQI